MNPRQLVYISAIAGAVDVNVRDPCTYSACCRWAAIPSCDNDILEKDFQPLPEEPDQEGVSLVFGLDGLASPQNPA
jgi:hypothetical protein